MQTFLSGQKWYELTNHQPVGRQVLGNPPKVGQAVLAVITDRRIQRCNVAVLMYYDAQVVSVSDYYPFGMGIKDRTWSDSTFGYRFGFNGKEMDDEVSGGGNTYDYGFRIYNSRIAKFLSVDPLTSTYPWYTPYQFAGNMPIAAVDLDGLEQALVNLGNPNDKGIRIVSFRHVYPNKRTNDLVHGTGGYGYSKPGRQQVRTGQLRPFSPENFVMTKKFINFYEPDPNGTETDAYGNTFTLTRGTYGEAMGKYTMLPKLLNDKGKVTYTRLVGFKVKGHPSTNIYFNNNKSGFKKNELNNKLSDFNATKKQLDKIGAVLEANPNAAVALIGYTDKDADDSYNKELSKKRIESISKYLNDNFNISDNQILSDSKGEAKANQNVKSDTDRKVEVKLMEIR